MAFQKVQDIVEAPFLKGEVWQNDKARAGEQSYAFAYEHGLNANYTQGYALLKCFESFPYAVTFYFVNNPNQRDWSKADNEALVNLVMRGNHKDYFGFGWSQGGMGMMGQLFNFPNFWHAIAVFAGKTTTIPLVNPIGLDQKVFQPDISQPLVGSILVKSVDPESKAVTYTQRDNVTIVPDYNKIKPVHVKVFHHENDPTMGESMFSFAAAAKAQGVDVEVRKFPGSGHNAYNPSLVVADPEGLYAWVLKLVENLEKVDEPDKYIIQFERDIESDIISGSIFTTDIGCQTNGIISIPDTTNGRHNMGVVDYIHEMQFNSPTTVYAPENFSGSNFSRQEAEALSGQIVCDHPTLALVGAGKGVMEASNVLKSRVGFMGIVASKTAITDFESYRGIEIWVWRGLRDAEAGASTVAFYKGLVAAGVTAYLIEHDGDHDSTVAWVFDPSNSSGFWAKYNTFVAKNSQK